MKRFSGDGQGAQKDYKLQALEEVEQSVLDCSEGQGCARECDGFSFVHFTGWRGSASL